MSFYVKTWGKVAFVDEKISEKRPISGAKNEKKHPLPCLKTLPLGLDLDFLFAFKTIFLAKMPFGLC